MVFKFWLSASYGKKVIEKIGVKIFLRMFLNNWTNLKKKPQSISPYV